MNTSEERSADAAAAAAAAAAPTSGDEPPHEEEQRWVDASIRWDDHQDDVDDEESDDERDAFDPFKEDPSQSFTFAFHLDEATRADANSTSRPPAAGNADGAASSSAAQGQAPPGEQDDESPQPNANVISIKLNGYKYDSDETFNSTGLTLWRAAEHLCYYLIRHRDVLQNKRMCELGCGLGLCGILAHRLTALAGANVEKDTCKENTSAVYLTDGDTDALAQLRANVRLNAPPSESNAGAIHCNQLIWGRQNTANFLQRHCSNRKFDILMASDVVYVADIIAPLMETVQTLLAPGGVFWFAYCSRRNVPVKIDLVLEAVLESGLVYEGVEEVDGIMIYEIRWGTSGGNAEKSETDNGEKMEDAMSSRSTTSSTNEPVRPFEWLTNFSSLSNLLSPTYLFPKDRKIESIGRALHVGCGTSTLGECLVEELGYTEVVNADVDEEALSAMEKRWSDRCSRKEELEVLETMKWQKFDFGKVIETSSDLTFERGYFDVVVDKSTLDCALCSGDGAAGLMVESYNALRPDGGVYVCISFNHIDFIGPLVRDCPGTDWDVEHVVVKRKVDVPEHLAGRIKTNSGPDSDAHIEQPGDTQSSAWTDGSFNPDDEYRRQCNVFICRRNGDEDLIHFDAVRDHLHRVNDAWFKTSNPMVTHTREADLRAAFESRLGAVHANDDRRDGTLPLRDCFDILFTEAEREHLTFEFFLEDWEAFCANHDNASKDSASITVDTALLFLKEMQ